MLTHVYYKQSTAETYNTGNSVMCHFEGYFAFSLTQNVIEFTDSKMVFNINTEIGMCPQCS